VGTDFSKLVLPVIFFEFMHSNVSAAF